MTTKTKNQQEGKRISSPLHNVRSRWVKIDTVIHEWLKERQELLVLYTQVSKNPASLETFCQILVDYIAAAHFEIHQKLALAQEICCPQHPTLNPDLLGKISKTTLIALNFNDKYVKGQNLASLSNDLSLLGEHLANRMECEDQLLQSYFETTEALQ